MDTYLERWTWLGLALVGFALLSPSAVVVGLALWLWLHWQRHARWRWVIDGMLLVASWAEVVLLWDTLAGQLVALREAITGSTGLGTLLMRALPVWGEGALLGPTIADVVQPFRPLRLVKYQPAWLARSEQPAQTHLKGVQRQLTLPSPAVRPDPPPDAPCSFAP